MNGCIAIISARLNSSRLPKKHLLKLAGKPLISRIFERLETIPEFDHIILATTNDDYNQPLVDWCQQHQKNAYAFQGDVNDVTTRIDQVVKQYDPDIIVYVCGDSPLIEPTTIRRLVKALKASAQAVMSIPTTTTGHIIHTGFDIYKRCAWDQMVQLSNTTSTKEHVGSALKPLYQTLSIAKPQDEPVFSEMYHRISVDTPSDYRFMDTIYQLWYQSHAQNTIVSLPWVIRTIQADINLIEINQHVRQRTLNEIIPNILFITHTSKNIGLGHVKRTLVAARGIQDYYSGSVKILIQGSEIDDNELLLMPHQFIDPSVSLENTILDMLTKKTVNVIVFDLKPNTIKSNFTAVFDLAKKQNTKIVSIDQSIPWDSAIDLYYIPSFYLHADAHHQAIIHGFEYMLLEPRHHALSDWQEGPHILVLTGSADTFQMGQSLPSQLDQTLPKNLHIHWIQGPYAEAPKIPKSPRLTWYIHENINNIRPVIQKCQYAIAQYGVSYFECLLMGLPTVMIAPQYFPDKNEISALEKYEISLITIDIEAATKAISQLLNNHPLARKLVTNATQHIDGKGLIRFADNVITMINTTTDHYE